EAGGGVAGGLGVFGDVLGQVAGDHGVADVAVAAEGDVPDVELGAPVDGPAAGLVGVVGGAEPDVGGGVADGVVQGGAGEAGWGWDDGGRVGRVDPVQAQQGVEVRGGAGLELGGLAVGEPHGRDAADAAGGGQDADGRVAAAA